MAKSRVSAAPGAPAAAPALPRRRAGASVVGGAASAAPRGRGRPQSAVGSRRPAPSRGRSVVGGRGASAGGVFRSRTPRTRSGIAMQAVAAAEEVGVAVGNCPHVLLLVTSANNKFLFFL